MLKKKKIYLLFAGQRLSAPLFLNTRIGPIQGMEPGTYHFAVKHSTAQLVQQGFDLHQAKV